jgi:hypothetical protein
MNFPWVASDPHPAQMVILALLAHQFARLVFSTHCFSVPQILVETNISFTELYKAGPYKI